MLSVACEKPSRQVNILKMALRFFTFAIFCFLTTTTILSDTNPATSYGGSQMLRTAESNCLQKLKKVDKMQKGLEKEPSKATACKAGLARKQLEVRLRKEKATLENKKTEERAKTLAEELARREREELLMMEKLALDVLERAKTSEVLERAKTSAEKLISKQQEEMLQEEAMREWEKTEEHTRWAAEQVAKINREKLARQELRGANSRQLARQEKSTLKMQEAEERSKSSAVELGRKQREQLLKNDKDGLERLDADDRAISAKVPDTRKGGALKRQEKAKLKRKELMARAKTAAEKLEKNQLEELERQEKEKRECQGIEERFKSAAELLQNAKLKGKKMRERKKLSTEELARKQKRGLHWLGMKREDERAKTTELATDQQDELMKTENDTRESKERTKVVRAAPEFMQSRPAIQDHNSPYLNDTLEFQNFTKISVTGLVCCLRKTFNFTDQLVGISALARTVIRFFGEAIYLIDAGYGVFDFAQRFASNISAQLRCMGNLVGMSGSAGTARRVSDDLWISVEQYASNISFYLGFQGNVNRSLKFANKHISRIIEILAADEMVDFYGVKAMLKPVLHRLAGPLSCHTGDSDCDFRACEAWGDSDCTFYLFIINSCCLLAVMILVACITLPAKAAHFIVARLVRILPKYVCFKWVSFQSWYIFGRRGNLAEFFSDGGDFNSVRIRVAQILGLCCLALAACHGKNIL